MGKKYYVTEVYTEALNPVL